MVMFSRPACRTRWHIKIDNKSFEWVKQFRSFVITLTNQHCIHEKNKTRLKLGNVCYHSAQNILSCSFLSKNITIKIYRRIILPVILFGCETWSLKQREKHKWRVFENRVLRKIFGPNRDEVTGVLRRLHNEEIYDLYSSPNIIRLIKSRRTRQAGHEARVGGAEVYSRVFVWKREGKRPFWKTRSRWDDNIEIDLQEV